MSVRCSLFLSLAALLGCVPPAEAGPWLRETGSGFGSASFLLGAYDTSAALYLEYGLTPETTFGAKIEYGETETVQLFLRRGIDREGTTLFAYDVGIGIRRESASLVPLLRLGLSAGRGIQLGERHGWVVLDSLIEYPASGAPLLKIDGTAGLTFSNHWQAMMQVFASVTPQSTEAILAPSLIWTPPEHGNRYQIGLEFTTDAPRLRLSVWRDF